MSDTTKIEWAHATWNPWEGCTKVSPGCAHCYAETRNHRFGLDNWGSGKPRRRTSAAYWRKPTIWDASIQSEDNLAMASDGPCGSGGERMRVFPSLCDWLDEEVPIEWLADFLKLIQETPNLDWLLLTKRPELWEARLWKVRCLGMGLASRWLDGNPARNVWIGVSIEDQQRADERIPELLKIPAAVRFLSVEPMLGEINFPLAAPCGYYCECETMDWPAGHRPGHGLSGIDWVIVGGESGPKARPCNIEWIRFVLQQCKSAGVPCFVKQLGAHCGQVWSGTRAGFGVPLPIRHPKGGDPLEWPEDLRVREFPSQPISL